LLGDGTAFAARDGSFGFVYGGQDFRATTFAFFPEGEGFLNGVFLTAEAACRDGLADEGFVVGG
jgi:hypothetical protein